MRILIKIGSSLLSKKGRFNGTFLEQKVNEISTLFREGNEIMIVTSGAVALGMTIENLSERPTNAFELQLLSGEGQILLMKRYVELFDKKNIKIAQVLLTHHNFDADGERETLTKIIRTYLEKKIIPIINENDLINKEELESENVFTDNDILSAIIAKNLGVDLVVILTDVAGLHDTNPRLNGNSNLIEEITEITPEIENFASNEAGDLGTGGMSSKIAAAKTLLGMGIDMIVADGNLDIRDIITNKEKRTLFKANL